MIAIGCFMDEGIKHTNYMCVISRFALPVEVLVVLIHFLKDLYFVEGSLHILRAALLDFHSNIGAVLKVFT